MIEGAFAAVKQIPMRFRTIAQKCGVFAGPARLLLGRCLLCDEAGETPGLCDTCRTLLDAASPGKGLTTGLPLVAAYAYRFPLDHLVHRFKFSADFAAGCWLADALASAAAGSSRPDVLVPAPSSARRLRERGFDPALLIARRVARRLGLRLEAGALVKVRHTPPQTSLSREQREHNLRGAFACGPSVRGLSVAVVDDVVTTGATQRAMAACLLAAGAREVRAWAVALTPPPE